MFHTTYETEVMATADSCNAVVDDMIYCLQTNPELLSEHYFAGLGMQEDTDKNAFYLEWKESSYYPEKQYSKLVLDVLVNEKPYILTKHIYAVVSVCGCCLYYLLSVYLGYTVFATVFVLIFTVTMRLLAAKLHWKLPKIEVGDKDRV